MMGDDAKSAGTDLGFVEIDGTTYMQMAPRFDFRLGKLGLGLQVPMNVPIHPGFWSDNDSENNGGNFLREEDWDEASDYFRMVRYVQWGQKRDFIYTRFGELTGSIGHGTIVGAYSNNLDVNSFRPGLQFDLNTSFGGFETLVSDVVTYSTNSPDSKLFAVRGYIKPVGLLMADSPLNIFSLGVSFAGDTNAPKTLGAADESGDFVVDSTDGVKIYGVDLDAEVLNNDVITLVPYMDFNMIDGAGTGFHLGLQAVLKFPVGLDLAVPITLEYRKFSSNYMAQYFDTFYELERFAMLSVAPGTPKGEYIKSDAIKDGDGLDGYYGDFAFDFLGIAQVGGIYEHYKVVASSEASPEAEATGDDAAEAGTDTNGLGNLSIYLSVPALDVLDFQAYYNRKGITCSDDMFKFDDRSMAVAQARYKVYPMLYVVAQYQRLWAYNGESAQWEAKDNKGFGVEFVFEL
jgi:hypothetical protein